jgi:tRNA(fMet)-specific endonuclease VapC
MYLIDTNVCIYLITSRSESVRKRIEQEQPYDIAVSAISVAELEYGVAKSRSIEQNRTALRSFFSTFEILPFDDRDAEQFGVIRALLEKRDQSIGAYDLEIAAQALARKMTVVTNNEREFRRVPGLMVENWVSV